MASITLTEDDLRQISLFQDVTGVSALDCLESEERVVLVVPAGEVGRAVGRKGEKVNHFRELLHKEVQIVEHSPDPGTFIKNVFRNYGVRQVSLEERGESCHAVVTVDPARKGRAIGRGGSNLRLAREIIGRHHNVNSVVVA